METYSIKYALNKEGKMVSIEKVENGFRCGCKCPCCDELLIARNDGDLRTHHFAHTSGIECDNGFNASISHLVKEILLKSHRLYVPSGSIKLKNKFVYDPKFIRIKDIECDVNLGISNTNDLVDLVITTKEDEKLLVLLLNYKGKFSAEFLECLEELNEDVLMIDLSGFDFDKINKNNIKEWTLKGLSNKYWINLRIENKIKDRINYYEKLIPLEDQNGDIKVKCPRTNNYVDYYDKCLKCDAFLRNVLPSDDPEDFLNDNCACLGVLPKKVDYQKLVEYNLEAYNSGKTLFELAKPLGRGKHIYRNLYTNSVFEIIDPIGQYEKKKIIRGRLVSTKNKSQLSIVFYFNKNQWEVIE